MHLFRLKPLGFVPLFVLILVMANGIDAFAQQADSATQASSRRANKAALMSAVVPGAGQVMNRKYWKLPILYGAAGALAYFIHTNNKEYLRYKDAIILRNDNDPGTVDEFPRFTDEDLTVRKDYYRRNRDLSYILAGVLYTLNIIDAYVDSQLMDFDVSDNLTLHPSISTDILADGSPYAGLKLSFNFK